MEDKKGAQKALRSDQGLGFLAGSTAIPRKATQIQGVGAGSLFALDAQLAKQKQDKLLLQEGKLTKEDVLKQRSKGAGHRRGTALTTKTNRGVEQRDARDKLQSTAQQYTEASRLSKLEAKAELYNKLQSGQVQDEQGRYEVDFFLKQGNNTDFSQQQSTLPSLLLNPSSLQPAPDTAGLALGGGDNSNKASSSGMMTKDMQQEIERRQWEQDVGTQYAQEAQDDARRDAKIETTLEVHRDMEQQRKVQKRKEVEEQVVEDAKQQRYRDKFLKLQKKKLLKAASGSVKVQEKKSDR